MRSLARREEILIAFLQDLFPAMQVRGALQFGDGMIERALARPPAIFVQATGWHAPAEALGQTGGAMLWTIRLINGDLRGPHAQRLGTFPPGGPPGLLPASELLREVLAGFRLDDWTSPLLPMGGASPRPELQPSAWDERFVEHLPAPGHVRPALARRVILAGVLTDGAAVDDTLLSVGGDAIEQFAEGDLLAVESPDATRRAFLGAVGEVGETTITVERAPGAGFATGSSLWRLDPAVRLPATPAPGEREAHLSNRRVDVDLAGGRHGVRLAPARRTVRRTFGPLRRAEAETLLRERLLTESASLLYAAHDGRLEQAHLEGEALSRLLGFDLVAVELTFVASDIAALESFEEVAP
jgi:hypothetical protein